MADIMGARGGPATSNGHEAALPRPTAPPAQTGSPQGIRGPRMIMRERQEREARRAEREQMERARVEEEARAVEEQNRRAAERRAAAGAAASSEHYPAPDPLTQRRHQRQQQSHGGGTPATAAPRPPVNPDPTTPTPLRPTRVPTTTQAPQGYSNTPAGDNITAAPHTAQETAHTASAARQPRTTFPHAFERWEALSAHWEGMTSFWIRKLQENTDEISQSPISTQLTRQVGDLSAAGANLFHAVVELQRLRASSERKFQRWFFDTRAEMERSQEITAMLENALKEEREGRQAAIRNALANNDANSKVQKQLAEMRKELAISKEEARRAWEELGRREQDERDRTHSLQQGNPTLVGGVQVVPMTQGVPSRQTSTRAAAPPATPEQANSPAQNYEYSQAQAAPTSIPAPAPNPVTPQHQEPQPDEYRSDDSGDDLEEEQYATPSIKQERTTSNYPPSSSQYVTSGGPSPGQQSTSDYSGQGYAAPGWETVHRHHHPTRLSDVIEEDERSRASTSHVSRH